MEEFQIISFTHSSVGVEHVGDFHIEESEWKDRFSPIKEQFELNELMYLSTCNRVEFLLRGPFDENASLPDFFSTLFPDWKEDKVQWAVKHSSVYSGLNAVEHLFRVSGSLDSLVIGEREILSQVKNAFEASRSHGLSGDFMRITMRKTIETAKQIFTETEIANKPVSVVNLAYRKLRDLDIAENARVLFVGAGKTNAAMAKHLRKHGFKSFSIFNRTVSKAEEVAKELDGKAYPLSDLPYYKGGFDVLITCTGAVGSVITPEIYESLLGEDTDRKVVIDLAIPNDLDASILEKYPIHYIDVKSLKEIADKNMAARKKELINCERIIAENLNDYEKVYRTRQVELAMRSVPETIKEIKDRAMNQVFADEVAELDQNAKEVLDKVISYMEKKYISTPMKMAKNIFLNEDIK